MIAPHFVQQLHLAIGVHALPEAFMLVDGKLAWTQASLELIRSFADHGGQRIVGVGTCAEYDWRFGYCSEALTPLRPATLYGASKAGLFQILEAFTHVRDLSFTWGRIFYPYGPEEARERLLPSVINGLLRGERVPCTDGSQIRDFLHVSDVAGALVALLDSAVTGAVNLASGVPITVRRLVGLTADALGRSDLIAWGALPQRLNEPPLLVADIRRLALEVGWQPRYALNAGLRQTIGWWQSQLTRNPDAATSESETLPGSIDK